MAVNPNVGKSSIFNELTGLKQHTRNWPGKTVISAWGKYNHKDNTVILVDLSGTYSLNAHSKEEEVARDFICFGGTDKTLVVCDATSLERNMNLVLQTLEITDNVIVCLNLMDEARKRNIEIDIKKISEKLGVIVIPTSTRTKEGLVKLKDTLNKEVRYENTLKIKYNENIEKAINILKPTIEKRIKNKISSRFIALKLISDDKLMLNCLNEFLDFNLLEDKKIKNKLKEVKKYLVSKNYTKEKINDSIVLTIKSFIFSLV